MGSEELPWFDVVGASVLLLVTSPLLAVCALVIRLTSRGPVFFRAVRAGVGGREFTMYKLRTMRHRPDGGGSRITAADDPRVLRFGKWLRRAHIDELPQLLNVLKGDMALVGPRPEDAELAAEHYTAAMRKTLEVRPGMTSPGALFAYTAGAGILQGGDDTEADYLENQLKLKLGFELAYLERRSFWYDARVMGRTLRLLLHLAFGIGSAPALPEYDRAIELAESL